MNEDQKEFGRALDRIQDRPVNAALVRELWNFVENKVKKQLINDMKNDPKGHCPICESEEME